jgi:hypothetical protein
LEDGKLFVIALRCGRLANRLTLFANFIALAEEQGDRVINVTFHSYADLFETTRRDIYCRYPVAKQRSWWDVIPPVAGAIRKTRAFYHATRAVGRLNERFPVLGRAAVTVRERPEYEALEGPEFQGRIKDARVVFVYGFCFRAPGCVRRHAEKIRTYFRPIEKHDLASRQMVERLRQNADIVVGVHIRRGDYREWRHGRYFFPASRYASWMREFAEQFPGRKVAFLVCSNEPRNAGEFPELSVGFGVGSAIEDIYALARCDYVIAPVGSFSQWASFYGNKPLFHLRDSNVSVERGKFFVSDLGEVPR